MNVWVPILAALGGAAIGFLGAGGIRLLLDRRQELVRAQAYGRVILVELMSIEQRLDPELAASDPILATEPLPTTAWHEHRTDVAAVILYPEFLALTSTYRAVGAANRMSAHVRMQWDSEAHKAGFAPTVPEDVRQERAMILVVVRSLGIPSIKWLAEGQLPFWRRRRTRMMAAPHPFEKCRCGHRWDCHRWTRWLRRVRLPWQDDDGGYRAHECNLVGCGCTHFSWASSKWWQRPLRRLRLLPQAPDIASLAPPPEPEVDTSIPMTARVGAPVTPDEHEALENYRGPAGNPQIRRYY